MAIHTNSSEKIVIVKETYFEGMASMLDSLRKNLTNPEQEHYLRQIIETTRGMEKDYWLVPKSISKLFSQIEFRAGIKKAFLIIGCVLIVLWMLLVASSPFLWLYDVIRYGF